MTFPSSVYNGGKKLHFTGLQNQYVRVHISWRLCLHFLSNQRRVCTTSRMSVYQQACPNTARLAVRNKWTPGEQTARWHISHLTNLQILKFYNFSSNAIVYAIFCFMFMVFNNVILEYFIFYCFLIVPVHYNIMLRNRQHVEKYSIFIILNYLKDIVIINCCHSTNFHNLCQKKCNISKQNQA